MWVIFSILAAFCWAISLIIDKYVLTKWIKQPFVPVIFSGTIGLIVGPTIYFVHGLSQLSYLNILLAFVVGIFYILSLIFYFHAAKLEEISRVSPLVYLSPLFIALFAALFLGEIFTPLKYLGIFLIIIGALLISVKDFSSIRLNKAFWLMILCVLGISIGELLKKYLLDFADYWTIFFYIQCGAVAAITPITYIYLPELRANIKQHGKKIIAVMSASEIINFFGLLSLIIALSVGYVTLVNALASIESFFVLLFAVILSIFYPSILKEEIGKSIIALKLLAIVLMFIGALLIT